MCEKERERDRERERERKREKEREKERKREKERERERPIKNSLQDRSLPRLWRSLKYNVEKYDYNKYPKF